MIAALEATTGLSGALRYRQEIPALTPSSAYAWLAELASRYPKLSSEFRAVFIAQSDDSAKPRITMGLGSKVTFDTFVGPTELTTRSRAEGNVVEGTRPRNPDDEFYPGSFAAMAELAQIADDLPLLGGWRCVTRPDSGLGGSGGPRPICSFTIPRIVIQSTGDSFDVISFDGRVELPDASRWGARQRTWGAQSFHARKATNVPDITTYRSNLAPVLQRLHSDALSKVVVTRMVDVTLDSAPEPLALAAAVSASNFPCYSYSFCWDNGEEWVGVSPESLLRKVGTRITTTPLAGTRSLPSDPAAEDVIRAELLRDHKENAEHQYAVELFLNDLKPLCGNGLQLDTSRTLVRTPYAFHIKSEISGSVEPWVGAFDVLAAIYPPATIWGAPRKAAREVLSEAEPFDRGFYTGGFGYSIALNDADFALAVRTARLNEAELSVFAGGGIVAQSLVDREWDEGRLKMTPFFRTINMDGCDDA